MSTLISDCPRCGANKITFDVKQQLYVGMRYQWQSWFELFCVCRNCHKSTVFVVAQEHKEHNKLMAEENGLLKVTASLNNFFRIESYISLRDYVKNKPPEFLPENIRNAFNEGATCVAVHCWNAASAMFRKCVDLATRPLLPMEEVEGLSKKQRRDLGLRLQWLFDNQKLAQDLRELSHCIREDGNDGAHAGDLVKADAEDLLDFTTMLLSRMYSEPQRLKLAQERRTARRENAD